MAQHRATHAFPLVLGEQVEVFNPLLAGLGPDGDGTRREPLNFDHKGVRGVKAVQEALPDAERIPASEAFEVWAHNLSTELCHP